MRWFGESWGALVCYETAKTDTPVGKECGYCQEKMKKDSQGIMIPGLNEDGRAYQWYPYHRECFLKMLGLRDE